MKNLSLFNLMRENPEKVIDKYYSNMNDIVIIPSTKKEDNVLTKATTDLYRYIDTFETLDTDLKEDENKSLIEKLLTKIDEILMNIENINYTSFCQYFMVQNISHSAYTSFPKDERLKLLEELIRWYIEHRHHLYKEQGYTNVVLQTMCDNYSHKRKGKAGIIKIIHQLKDVGITTRIHTLLEDEMTKSYYILPDKGDKKLFYEILNSHNIKYVFGKAKQEKLPDVLIKIDNDYFIVEHKSMKESGGGQDKQIVEVLDFIRHSEENPNIHYITYLDGIFSNKFLGHSSAKNEVQYLEIQDVLRDNPQNYFVNTYTFTELIKQQIKE